MTTATYTSQQSALYEQMVAYLQDPSNWPDGIPKITDFSVGSSAYTLLNAVAVGQDQVSLQQFNNEQQASVLTATGSSLDDIAANWGVTRKAAVAASGTFNFTRVTASSVDWYIPKGTLITTYPDSSGNTIQFTVDADATLTAGNTSIQVNATCSNPGPGSGGNLTASTPLLIGSALPGIDGVSLPADITNGIDEETNDALRARVLEAMQYPPGPGSVADYQEWATAVTGVGTATPLPLNRGPGTVDVLITGTSGTSPSAALISAVQSAIDAKAPADADVQVIAPTIVTVDSTVTLTLATGYTTASVTAAVQTAVAAYINGVQAGGTVYNSGVVKAALSVTGVLDAVASLSVGGNTQTNVVLTSQEAAQSGTVTVQ